MRLDVKGYKEWVHFSMNFYSLYLLVTFIPDIVGIDNILIKNIFWLIRILLACWVIFKEQQSLFHFNAVQRLYLAVCVIYMVNIMVDVYFDPNYLVLSKTNGTMDLIGFFIDLLLALTFRYDHTFDSENSFKFFWISLTIGLLLAFHFARLTPRLLLFDDETTRYDANSTINTINYGQYGCALCIVSIYAMLKQKQVMWKLFFIVITVIGLLSIVKAGSRSPVVVFALVMIFYMVARLGKLKGLLIVVAFGGLFLLFLNPLIEFLHSIGSNLGERLTNTVVNRDSSGREDIWKNVVGIIEKSPVFGAYYLVPSGAGRGMYPHNFYLEVFMATGIIGGIPFMLLIFITINKTYKLIRAQHPATWILLLYIQLIIFGFFSTGLYTSQELWILMFFILTIYIPPTEILKQNVVKYDYGKK